MLGLHQFTPWHRSVLNLPGGDKAETNVLADGARRVRLIFLNIADAVRGALRMPDLWDTPGTLMRTVLAEDSPLRAPQFVRPPDPGRRARRDHGPLPAHARPHARPGPGLPGTTLLRRKDNDQPGCSDHRDHTAIALFTWKAIAQWAAESTRRDKEARASPPPSFRGYYNQRWPHNLPRAVLAQKARVIKSYGG